MKNLADLVFAASFLAAVHFGNKPKLEIPALYALNAFQRIFGIPNFGTTSAIPNRGAPFRRCQPGKFYGNMEILEHNGAQGRGNFQFLAFAMQ
jgi:hypothetical protein